MQRSALGIALLLATQLAVAAVAETHPFLEMNEGMTTICVSAERLLAEENGFSEEDLSLPLDAMASTLPTLKKGIPSEVRIELRKKLEADKARFKKDEDAKRIDRMIGELGPV